MSMRPDRPFSNTGGGPLAASATPVLSAPPSSANDNDRRATFVTLAEELGALAAELHRRSILVPPDEPRIDASPEKDWNTRPKPASK